MIYDAQGKMLSTPVKDVDVVTVWPRGMDYPLYRQFIKKNRAEFKDVVIAFTPSWNGYDFREWIKKDMSDCKFVDAMDAPGDWRDAATKAALDITTGEHILFLEQDFMILSPAEFFRIIKTGNFDMVVYREGARLHPAMVRVRSDLVRMTSKNFSVDPGVSDHFYQFFKDIDSLGIPLEVMVMEDKDCGHIFNHLAGFTHNYSLCISGDLKSVYKPKIFKEWNLKSLEASVEQNDTFKNVMEMIERQMRELCGN